MWTDEQTAEIVRLRKDGRSSGEIARLVGRSRSAIVGKLHRIGLIGEYNSNRVRKKKANRKYTPGKNYGNWDVQTFAPYALWKQEQKWKRENGLR